MRPLGTRDEEIAKERAAADEAARLETRQRGEDLRAVMATPEGRRVFWRLVNDCHVHSSIFHPEPTQLAFLEGQRHVGAALLKELQVETREFYIRMLVEAMQRLPQTVPPSIIESMKR